MRKFGTTTKILFMTSYSFGDVVLVPFPFTDQSAVKKRPAVIVSSASYVKTYSDLILMAITSQTKKPLDFGTIEITDWSKAGLLKPSVIKPIFTTIEESLILRYLGKLETADETSLRSAIHKIIG